MARKLRIEFPNANYHLINRGNYRSDIFASKGARDAFLKTLAETCARTGWLVHAWCLMSNHYHLAVRTPDANLVAGMQWLQTTFAARFNRFRDERGHVFQGRYKAFNIEQGRALASVCHYIHLNPVRARMFPLEQAADWEGGSLRWLAHPKERPAWFDPAPALASPVQTPDTPQGRRAYLTYLATLATDEQEQKKQYFEQLAGNGWAVGSDDFKTALLQQAPQDPTSTGFAEAAGARVMTWQKTLDALRSKLSDAQCADTEKSADWKVALATEMKRRTTATNQWLTDALDMGSMFTVSRLAKECAAGKRAAKHLKALAGAPAASAPALTPAAKSKA